MSQRHEDDAELLRRLWERDAELILRRKRLMEGNQTEVMTLIAELEERCKHAEEQRTIDVNSLQLSLDATTERLRIANRRLQASEEAQSELQRETDLRLGILQHELESSRRELAMLQDSMRALIHAHKKAASNVKQVQSTNQQHVQRERDLELREIHLVDQLADAKSSMHTMEAQLAESRDRCADLERSYLQAQRDLTAAMRRLEDASSAKRTASEVQSLKEDVRLAADTNARLLHVISQFGSRECSNEELLKARELFRFVGAAGGHRFCFLGDASLQDTSVSNRTPDAWRTMQDLRTAVADHNLLINRVGDSANRATRVDPMLRLQSEKDFWLPKQVIDVASQFHRKYFSDSPIDILYTLVVDVAKSLREYVSNIMTPSEVALLDLERRERSAGRAAAAEAAVKRVTDQRESKRSTLTASCSCGRGAIDAKHDSLGKTTGGGVGGSRRALPPDTLRCLTGLRCLISQVDKLCTSSSVFKSLPASQVREILSSTLRTVESLADTCHDDAPPSANQCNSTVANNMEHVLEQAFLNMMSETNAIAAANDQWMKAVRSALKAPQDSHDPDLLHQRDCCASRGRVIVTKAFRGMVLSAAEPFAKDIADASEHLRERLLQLRSRFNEIRLESLRKHLS